MNRCTHHQIQYAGFLRRFSAFCVDGVIVSAITSALLVALYGVPAVQMNSVVAFEHMNWKMISLEYGLPLLWSVGFWLWWMATPGKLLMDCQVVDVKTLSKARFGQLLLRYLGYILSAIPFGLGFLWILFDNKNQGWHDKLSGTAIILQDDSLQTLESLCYERKF